MVVRGGGSRSDLAGFDSESIARTIALCPVPVLTGIGHEIDTSLADVVAHRDFKTPTACADFLVDHVTILCSSFTHWTQRELISRNQAPHDAARSLYFAPFAVVSHDTAPDPIFNYANRTALELLEMTWSELTTLPSRQSAEAVNREERAHLLSEVIAKGYIDDYQGVRISRTGRRFHIERATVWNLLTPPGDYYGQAAMFGNWRYL